MSLDHDLDMVNLPYNVRSVSLVIEYEDREAQAVCVYKRGDVPRPSVQYDIHIVGRKHLVHRVLSVLVVNALFG